MQLVLGRKQIHKWDLNELKPTSQENKKRGTDKGHGGGRRRRTRRRRRSGGTRRGEKLPIIALLRKELEIGDSPLDHEQ